MNLWVIAALRFDYKHYSGDIKCHEALGQRTAFEICEVCFREDDGQDDGDADKCRSGPNGALSLREARTNYLRFRACEASMIGNVRPPRPEEVPG